MIPECSRPLPLGRVGAHGLDVTIDATPAECGALALRMDLPAIHALSCRFHLQRRDGGVVLAHGRLCARVVRTCVVTLDDFDATVEEEFQVRFVPQGREVETVDLDADDEIPFSGDAVDLGEAAAEQLGLALEPYPRKPGAILEEPEEPVEATNPFAALRRLDD